MGSKVLNVGKNPSKEGSSLLISNSSNSFSVTGGLVVVVVVGTVVVVVVVVVVVNVVERDGMFTLGLGLRMNPGNLLGELPSLGA